MPSKTLSTRAVNILRMLEFTDWNDLTRRYEPSLKDAALAFIKSGTKARNCGFKTRNEILAFIGAPLIPEHTKAKRCPHCGKPITLQQWMNSKAKD